MRQAELSYHDMLLHAFNATELPPETYLSTVIDESGLAPINYQPTVAFWWLHFFAGQVALLRDKHSDKLGDEVGVSADTATRDDMWDFFNEQHEALWETISSIFHEAVPELTDMHIREAVFTTSWKVLVPTVVIDPPVKQADSTEQAPTTTLDEWYTAKHRSKLH